MQQRKGNFGRKPAPKKTIGQKPVKKAKSTNDESMVDLSSIDSYKETKPKKVVPRKKECTIVSKPYHNDYYGVTYELTGGKMVGITNRLIDRGNVVIHKGQCVMIFETKSPNVVQITTMDGRSAYALAGCFEKMNFSVK